MERNGHFHRAVTLLFPRTHRTFTHWIDWQSLGQIPPGDLHFTRRNLFVCNHISWHLISCDSPWNALSSVFWMRLYWINGSVPKSLLKWPKVALLGLIWLKITHLFAINFNIFIDRLIALAMLYQMSFTCNSIKWKFKWKNQSQSDRRWRWSLCGWSQCDRKLRHFLLAKQPRIVIRLPLVKILEKLRNKLTTFHQSESSSVNLRLVVSHR